MEKVKRIALIVVAIKEEKSAKNEAFLIIQKYKSCICASTQVTDDNGDILLGILAKINTDELGAITGSLGRIKGARVKSAVLKQEA